MLRGRDRRRALLGYGANVQTARWSLDVWARYLQRLTTQPVFQLADFVIANDADWSTTLTALAATTTDKLVSVKAGSYATQTIALDGGAGTVTFKAAASGARVEQLIIGAGSRNLVIDGLECVSANWSTTDKPALGLAGSQSRDLTIQNNTILGNYQGVVDFAIDPTSDAYSAYASINPSGYDANGGITGLTIQNSYVGDILPDQTDLALTQSSSQATGSGFTGLVDVVGGHLTNARVSTAGSGYNSTGETKTITWAGQVRMIDYMPNGLAATLGGGYAATGHVIVRNNTFRLCNNACKFSPTTGLFEVTGNTFQYIYQDHISHGHGNDNTAPPTLTTIAFNFAKQNLAKKGDPGDPHSDFIQFYMNDLSAPYTPSDWPLEIYGNVQLDGATRGYCQGLFIADNPTGIYYTGRICGNFICGNYTTKGLQFDACKDVYVYKNTFCRYNTADAGNTAALEVYVALGTAGQNFFGDNIYEYDAFTVQGNVYNDGLSDVVLGQNGATIAYGSVFAAPNSAMSTVADAVANFAPTVAYAGKGAFGDTGYIDHVNKTIDRTKEPTMARFPGLNDRTSSTAVSSNWCKVEGGPDTVAITGVTGGTWQVADDSSGTNATVATAADGSFARGKFLRLNQTTSASGSTTTTVTASLNGNAISFKATTKSAASFTAIDNQATAYSKIAQPASNSGLKKALIAVRVKPDALTAGANAIADGNASTFRLFTPSTSAWRFQFASSTALQYRQTTIPPSVGTTQTHLIAIDFTQTTQSGVCKWYIEGSDVGVPATGSTIDVTGTRTFDIATIFSSLGLGIFAEGDGGGTFLSGAIEFFWMDFGDASYALPDITDPLVRNKFTADNINLTDGSGVTGLQPKFFYPGASNLSAWNDGVNGVPNRGSLASLPLIKQAGTYA